MKKGSKPPEERRKELIETAAGLFAEKGYESVSVRDILKEVGGAPGMFYYYFKSKQDIYLATMEEYISENLERKCSLMEDKEMPFEERRRILSELIATDIKGYADRFSATEEETISDISYRIYDLIQMLGKLIRPYAVFMLQGIKEGKIQNRLGITEKNAEAMAAFVLYGIWGLIYNDRFTQTPIGTGPEDMEAVLRKLFY